MRFIDEALITVKAGDGGSGMVSFHRAAFLPKGGPDGGDGGQGGNIIMEASIQLATLSDMVHTHVFKAENGKPGQGSRKSGKSGKDLVITVPIGTLVKDDRTGEQCADFCEDKQRIIIAKGGKGGWGNCKFATATNRTPRRHGLGKPGEERWLRLEMKLIADVGLVGRPNAGKSTLLSALTRAQPRIAAYPFSTLTPGLGIVIYDGYKRFVVADIPGLAEGARDGKGLGDRFLRHIERTRLLLFLVETPDLDYMETYQGLLDDLRQGNTSLLQRPRLIIKSKNDLVNDVDRKDNLPFDLAISAKNGDGLEELIRMIVEKLDAVKEVEAG